MSKTTITISKQVDEVREVDLPVYTLVDHSNEGILSINISKHEAQRTVTLHDVRYAADHYSLELQVYPYHGLSAEHLVTTAKEHDFNQAALRFLGQLEEHTGVLTRYLHELGGMGLAYDRANDVLTVHGIRYAAQLFQALGIGGLQPGQVFKIVSRDDGTLTVERLDP